LNSTSALIFLMVLCLLALHQRPAVAQEGGRTYRVVGVEYDDVLNIRARPSVAGYVRGYVAEEPVTPRPRKRAQLPPYWRVTGVAEGESLKVHDGPSPSAQVVHAFEPQS